MGDIAAEFTGRSVLYVLRTSRVLESNNYMEDTLILFQLDISSTLADVSLLDVINSVRSLDG